MQLLQRKRAGSTEAATGGEREKQADCQADPCLPFMSPVVLGILVPFDLSSGPVARCCAQVLAFEHFSLLYAF
jgi:hypothetical protein